jgi:PAS domain S-box-containing protein
MANRIAVSSAEFIRNIGYWQSEALRQPISITHHGRERLVLAAPDAFHIEASTQETSATSALRADHAAVLENLDEGFLAFDAQLSVMACNTVAQAFTGRAHDDLRGVSVFECMPQPLASILADRLQRVLRGRKTERFEAGAFDGRQIEARVFPCSSGAAVLFHNVTEVFHLRRQIEQGEALRAAVQRHTLAAAVRLDARARIEAADDAFCGWSGFHRDDVVNHRFVDLVSPPERRAVAELIERVLREGAVRETNVTLIGKRGEELTGVLAAAPILTDSVAHGAQVLMVRNGQSKSESRAA